MNNASQCTQMSRFTLRV